MKTLTAFVSRFGTKVGLNLERVVEKSQRYYLVNPRLRKVARRDFFYAGLYLGKVKNDVFFPSFNLLNMLVEVAASKVVLDRKASWLFICGRDILQKGVLKTMGSKRKGDYTLVLNEYGECLGFGMITGKFDQTTGNMVVKNVLDIGDFLHREK